MSDTPKITDRYGSVFRQVKRRRKNALLFCTVFTSLEYSGYLRMSPKIAGSCVVVDRGRFRSS